MALLQFDARNVEPQSNDFEILPAGVYVAHITQSDVKTTKVGTGQYLSLTWEILDGQHKGRKVFENINFQNPSAKAQSIGQASLSSLCRAVNVPVLKDSTALHNKPCRIKVGIEKGDGQYGDKNNVKGYEAIAAGFAPAPQAPQQQQAAPANIGTPW